MSRASAKRRVRTFTAEKEEELDDKVNKWIERNSQINVINISLATSPWHYYHLTVLYEIVED